MKNITTASKLFFAIAALSAMLAGCNRPADAPRASSADTDTSTPAVARAPSSDESSGSSGTSSSAAGTGAAAGRAIDDSIITTKVKTALLADSVVKGTDISVETTKGDVLLSGAVASRDQADRALKIAKSVEGVKNVDNRLTVR